MARTSDETFWIRQPRCPYLPMVDQHLTADWVRGHRGRRDAGFYLASLEYGQSLWMAGKPAQAILQLNKAWSAELEGDEEILRRWPLPYRALIWMLEQAPEEGFLGNPVRHFQHLATRVSGANVELRSWRAWACYHLSAAVLDHADFPPDMEQVEREGIVVPEIREVIEEIRQRGTKGESEWLAVVMGEVSNSNSKLIE
ncbi:hypothetical protein ACFQY0_05595 [Haloferula chungangensis]|uniref:Uncharacterized protein n=1 Tax=Haloferula chungangensis TaxID=1048331 RepID=A0ABW2L4Z6_9BACT